MRVFDCSVGRSICDRWLFSSGLNTHSFVTSFTRSHCEAWYAPRMRTLMIDTLIIILTHFARLRSMIGI